MLITWWLAPPTKRWIGERPPLPVCVRKNLTLNNLHHLLQQVMLILYQLMIKQQQVVEMKTLFLTFSQSCEMCVYQSILFAAVDSSRHKQRVLSNDLNPVLCQWGFGARLLMADSAAGETVDQSLSREHHLHLCVRTTKMVMEKYFQSR